MRMNKRFWKSALAGLACVVGLAQLGVAAANEPVKGGRLNLVVQPEPPLLNLGVNKLGPTSFVGGKIYEGLITLSPDLKPLPRLAESWTVSPDSTTYVFNLRKDVTWHDGKPFTADDVIFSFTKFLPATTPRTGMVLGLTESITALDSHTVEFKFKKPFPALMMVLEATGGTIMPAHLYEGVEDFRTAPANNTIVGTGPFKVKEWRKGSYIHLVRNDNYWEAGKPHLDEIYFHVIPDANSRSMAFESGRIDAIRTGDVENFEILRLAENPSVELTKAGWEYYDPIAYLHINMRNKPMDDVRFRQALAHAIDRNFIIETIFNGFGRKINGAFSNDSPFKDTSVETEFAFDPAKARALLDEMGLKPDANGVRAELRLLPLPYGETWQRLAEFVREQLQDVGIKTQLVATDVPGWFQRITKGDFDLAFNYVYQLGDPAILMSQTYMSEFQFNGSTASNLGGYENAELDEKFRQAQSEGDSEKRRALYSEIQKTLSHDVPILWLHQMVMPTLYHKRVQNLVTTGMGMNENFADVWLKR